MRVPSQSARRTAIYQVQARSIRHHPPYSLRAPDHWLAPSHGCGRDDTARAVQSSVLVRRGEFAGLPICHMECLGWSADNNAGRRHRRVSKQQSVAQRGPPAAEAPHHKATRPTTATLPCHRRHRAGRPPPHCGVRPDPVRAHRLSVGARLVVGRSERESFGLGTISAPGRQLLARCCGPSFATDLP
jgi:hypothetical protein